jgi:hypothetical protein
MKPTMPLITLLGGATLGAGVLVASMLASGTPRVSQPAASAAAAAAAGTTVTLPAPASSATVVTLPSPVSSGAAQPASSAGAPAASSGAAQPGSAAGEPAASSGAAPAASAAAPADSAAPATAATTAGATTPPPTGYAAAPANADYAAQVNSGGPSVAVAVHGKQAVAYVCDGHRIGQWFKGTAQAGHLDLTGRNGARLTVTYGTTRAAGSIAAGGQQYTFSAPTVSGSSGLYQSTAVVGGTEVEFGWIVLPNGYQVGSADSELDSATPLVTSAPALDLATDTSQDGGVLLVATQINGATGSGF